MSLARTRPLVVTFLEDDPALVGAQALFGLVHDVVAVSADTQDLADLRSVGLTLVAAVAEGLRSTNLLVELYRLRQADVALGHLRAIAWVLYAGGELSGPLFDDLMAGSARCRRELHRHLSAARHRGRRRIDTPLGFSSGPRPALP